MLRLLLLLAPVLLCSSSRFGRCPRLQAAIVCRPERAGLSYSDGCNEITCLANGRTITTSMYCPLMTEPSPRCDRLEAELRQKLKSRGLH